MGIPLRSTEVSPPATPPSPRDVESLVRESFDCAPIGMALTSLDGRWIRVNRALCDILGYSEPELLATTFLAITYHEDLKRSVELHGSVLAGERTRYQFEKRYVRRDGSPVWVSLTVALLRSGTDAPIHLLAQIQDISERVAAAEQLRESELLLRSAQEVAHIGSWAWDVEHSKLTWSDELYRMYGLPLMSDITMDRFMSAIHPNDRERVTAQIATADRRGGDFTLEFRIVRPDGSQRELCSVGRVITEPSGAVVRVLGSSQDVTERRAAEVTQRWQSETLQAIGDYIPAMISFSAPDGRPVYANREWHRLAGWNLEDFSGFGLLEALYPDATERQRVLDFMQQASGAVDIFRMRTSDGRMLDAAWACIRLSDGSIVGVAQDLTERHRLEEQLRHAQKMEAIGRLAGGVAHDFNNLLTVIQSYGTFIAEELPRDSPMYADLGEILAATERATGLTRQLLAFGRRQMLQPRSVDVNLKVANIVGMLRRVIGEDVTLRRETATPLWPIFADPAQLEQVLLNLAVNARDAMPSGGILTIRTANLSLHEVPAPMRATVSPGDYVSIVVEDTGVGIRPEHLSQIFEPFFTTKATGKGTGLGLATVYGIVTQSGGHVHAESEVGRGSRFTVLLPRSTQVPEEPETTKSTAPSGRETILIVEDDATVRTAVRRKLEGLGYRVREAATGAEALGILEMSRDIVHLVLTDVVMPDIEGHELAECILERKNGPRVLYMSGYSEEEIRRRGVGASGIALLQKPFTTEVLACAVRDALDGRTPAAQSRVE